MHGDKYGERRGAAFGLAGVAKGFGVSSLKKYGIAAVLREGLEDRLVLSFRYFFFLLAHDEVLNVHFQACDYEITTGVNLLD